VIISLFARNQYEYVRWKIFLTHLGILKTSGKYFVVQLALSVVCETRLWGHSLEDSRFVLHFMEGRARARMSSYRTLLQKNFQDY